MPYFTPQLAPVLKGALAPAGAGSILTADAVDKLMISPTTLLDYMRAKNCNAPTTTWKTRAGGLIVPGNATAALVPADANFAGLQTIDISAMTAAGIPFVTNIAVPSSFTFMATLRTNGTPSTNWNLFGDTNVSTTVGGAFVNIQTNGTINSAQMCQSDTGWSDSSHILVPATTTSLVWVSHNAATAVTSYGKSTAIVGTHTDAAAHTGGSGNYLQPFSNYSSSVGHNLPGHVEGYALFGKAFANDGSTEDNAIAAIITAWRSLVGATN